MKSRLHRSGDSPRLRWLLLAALILAYGGAFAFCNLLTRGADGLPTFWPLNAILAAGLVRLSGVQRALLLAAAAALNLAIHALSGDGPALILAYTACDLAESLAAAAITHRLYGPVVSIRGVRRAMVLVAALLPVTLVTAAIGSALTAKLGGGGFSALFSAWATSGGGLGMMIVLPAALVILDPTPRTPPRWSLAQQMGFYAFVAVSTAAAFSDPRAPLTFLVLPAAMLAAFQLGPRGAAWSAVIVLCVAMPMLALADVMGAAIPRFLGVDRVRVIQFFVATLFFTCLAAALTLDKQTRLKRIMIRRSAAARAARARAQAAGRARTDFLATMSHEIRTPLNSVLGFADLLTRTEPGLTDAGRRKLELIGQAGGSLATIVDDILDFSRLEAGRVMLRPEAVDPGALLSDAVSIIAPAARAKGLNLTIEADLASGETYALDPARLRQVLLNLLNNAVKFTHAGGVVARVRLERRGDGAWLRFTVTDTGIGIAPEVQGRLFQRFSQADGSISRAYGGAGLGLAISRTLVSRMGGEIGVDSQADEGSTFWFTTPAEAVCAAETSTTVAQAAARILLVDDHPMNRELGAAMLTLAGCQVETAEDGEEAVRSASAGGFDVILMDIHMPRMDGLAAARAIKALDGAAAATPIIALSADVMPQQIEACRAAGMVDHVAKPIQHEVLMAAVARWVA